jgi:hypothetical protein
MLEMPAGLEVMELPVVLAALALLTRAVVVAGCALVVLEVEQAVLVVVEMA